MYLYQFSHFKLPKDQATGALLQQVYKSLRDSGYEDPHVAFYLDDSGISKVSACQRAMKKFTELKEFSFSCPAQAFPDRSRLVLHNLDERWQIATSPQPRGIVPWKTLIEIANGIPQAYPFWTATFIIEMPDWLEQQNISLIDATSKKIAGDTYLAAYLIPNICLQSSWGRARRSVGLSAMIPCPIPADDARKRPPFPPRMQAVLDPFGKLGTGSLSLIQSAQEEAAKRALDQQARQILDRVRMADRFEVSPEVYDRLTLPHDLPSVDEVGLCGEYGSGPTRKVLDEVFRPRGYRALRKTTARNNRIKLDVDTGSFIRSASFHLTMQGFNWYQGIGIGVSKKAASDTQYPIFNQDQWRQICENVGVVVDYVEKEVFSQIEQVYLPTPKWFEFTK